MHARVRVESVDAIKQFRGELWKFAQEARSALSDAQSDLRRTCQWLEQEQGPWWLAQCRKRQEVVTEAKRALDEKRLYKAPDGGKPSTVEEEAALKLALRRREEAERKLEAVKRWRRQIDREAADYQAAAQRLARAVDHDIPNAAATVDRLMDALEKYFALQAPQARHGSDTTTSDEAPSMGLPASLVLEDDDVDDAEASADEAGDVEADMDADLPQPEQESGR
ncbi:MAG: hypothetical protein WD534_12375 [Phycisphaeraceae bacterium]